MKLCLITVKDGGDLTKFLNDDSERFDFKTLSELTTMPIETVAEAMLLFSRIELIELTDDGYYKLNLKGGSLWQITENIITLS